MSIHNQICVYSYIYIRYNVYLYMFIPPTHFYEKGHSKNKIDLNTGAFDISLNTLPNKLRLPEKVSTIAANILRTAISSV